MSNTRSVIIAGVVRNNGHSIVRNIRAIHSAFNKFEVRNWIIVESDSDDNTVNEINKIIGEYKITLVQLGDLRHTISSRTERIAYCRNKYVDVIKSLGDNVDADFVVVVDLDDVNTKLNSKNIETCWESNLNWDVCFPNQDAPYYDIYALRRDYWSDCNCDDLVNFYVRTGMHFDTACKKAIYDKMIRISQDSEPIPVMSAFGGLAIYKRRTFCLGRYKGKIGDTDVCEHVSFHLAMHEQGARMYIIPKLINHGWNEHSLRSIRVFRYLQKIRARIGLFYKKFK